MKRRTTILPLLICALFLAGALDRIDTVSAATLSGPAGWGNPNRPWGIRQQVTDADRVLIAKYRSGIQKPVIEEHFIDPAELTSLWELQSDDNPGLKSCRRPKMS